MHRVQKMIDLMIKIGEFNISNFDSQLNENYKNTEVYQKMDDEEKELCHIYFGDCDNLSKIMISGDELLDYLKGFIRYNGFFEAELNENELDLFLKEFIYDEYSIFKKLLLDYQIRYSNPTVNVFDDYNKDSLFSNIMLKEKGFSQVSIISLGENLFIGLPLMVGSYISNDYLVMNIMKKVLEADYIIDSDMFFEFFKVYDDYRQSHISERTLNGNLGNIPLMYKEINIEMDEIFKNRFERSLNPEFKLHLKIYDVTNEFLLANKGDSAFIYEASRNYNPTIKKIYDLYEEIDKYYRPFMTDADYLILEWMRYKIAIDKGDLALAEVLGKNILLNQDKLRKLPRTFYIYTNYVLPMYSSKGELLRDFYHYYTDEILFNLLDYYVQNYRYEDAYVLLKENDFYFTTYLSYEENNEMYRKFKLEKLEKHAQWDIGLIIGDLRYTYNDNIASKWFERIESATSKFKISKTAMDDYYRYKNMSLYIRNVIIVMISIEDYESAKELLLIYNKYLIKDEDYIALEKFVNREFKLKSDVEALEEMLGLFSLEVQSAHKFLDNFYELTNSEMSKEISLSESEENVIKLLANDRENDYKKCFELIKNSQEKYIKRMTSQNYDFDFYSAYFDKPLSQLASLVKSNPSYEEVEENLEKYYADSWNKFAVETRKYLITGNVLYKYLSNRSDNKKFDYSPICLCWAKSVENEFQKKLFTPLIRAYNDSIDSNEEIKYPQSTFLLSRNKIRGSQKADIKNFTLGSLTHISGLNKWGKITNDDDWNRFDQFLKDNIYKSLNDFERKNKIQNIIEKSEKLNYDYRIKAAHPLETINIMKLELCKDIVFQSQELLKEIVEDMDIDWPLASLSFK